MWLSDRVVLLSTCVVVGMHWENGSLGGGVRPNNFPIPNWNHFPIVWEPKRPHFFSFRQLMKPFTLSSSECLCHVYVLPDRCHLVTSIRKYVNVAQVKGFMNCRKEKKSELLTFMQGLEI